ncbi:hypothetical protein [Psychroserpens sp.]|uniref:hypothetical protein n=1 Tax=Psychroserpens sp. TaxID=2020870 RepID=UPI001B0B5E20|nr:hypothetical protein [Psychroserpens sp.]MBO6607593.1 hypothetical protein [Psychroserpens sp.]MBO6631567.1 hypothetical protein [Psychroserpens sp.]MBO6655095.1 hypothetical protein [Psychroserpens sp.]MBO6683100.1 hypothetical protein [Psychroserpens sp.]MBO6749721.1 hypothetical protein [Psychroserpens sp.]
MSIFLICFISFSIIGAIFLFHAVEQVPLKVLTRDIVSTGDLPVYIGLLSQLGIFIWAATAAICLFASQVLHSKGNQRYLIIASAISLYLGIDDAFLLHESVFPAIGIHQKIVIASYGLLMAVFLWNYRKTILSTDYLLMAIAFICFATSILIDNLFWKRSPLITNLLEDGAKFVGLVAWITYFARTAKQFIRGERLETA